MNSPGSQTCAPRQLRLKLVSAHIHARAGHARAPFEVGGTGHIDVSASINARRVGLQPQVALSQVHKTRFVGDVADPISWHWRSAAEIEGGAAVV